MDLESMKAAFYAKGGRVTTCAPNTAYGLCKETDKANREALKWASRDELAEADARADRARAEFFIRNSF